MLPLIALVGRPNVGKSTLFNKITNSRQALVANTPGLTRDRNFARTSYNDIPFMLVDTGGLEDNDDAITHALTEQTNRAIKDADRVILLVDGKSGLTAQDEEIIKTFRKNNQKFYLAVNKLDLVDPDIAIADFMGFGLDDIYGLSANRGLGLDSLLEDVLQDFSSLQDETPEIKGIKVAIVGRPNAGKSTLVNRILGDDRVIVSDKAHTTRDSIYIPFNKNGTDYTIIDTAGLRKKRKVNDKIEKFSAIKSLAAIEDANVVVLMIDARENLGFQDLTIIDYIIDSRKPFIICFNKWDNLDDYSKSQLKEKINWKLRFVQYVKMHFISALHGTNVGHIFKSINNCYQEQNKEFNTGLVNRILEKALKAHNPPLVKGRRVKIKYAHPLGKQPLKIVIHGNQLQELPSSYKKYLEKTFQRELNLERTSVQLIYRTSENPYA